MRVQAPPGGMRIPLSIAEGDFSLPRLLSFHRTEPFQEAVLHALGFVAGHGIQRHGVDAAEDAVFNVGVVALEAAEQTS